MKIFKNTGNGFELHQTLPLSSKPLAIDLTSNGSKLFVSFYFIPAIDVYEQGSNGMYTKSDTILTPCDIYTIVLSGSQDQILLVNCKNVGEINIYK